MRIRWTPAAAGDLEQISDYLKDRHPRYRLPTMRKLYQAIGTLKKWPQSGRIGREAGTRKLLFSPLPSFEFIAVTARHNSCECVTLRSGRLCLVAPAALKTRKTSPATRSHIPSSRPSSDCEASLPENAPPPTGQSPQPSALPTPGPPLPGLPQSTLQPPSCKPLASD